ncbi:hypothetical protein DENSPDRAFT_452584 [Dentipellis sp. KUC8613]|nr:hypothetical protein DENSPDRAFT_452584 [Dentipellis sp. KUC8613]
MASFTKLYAYASLLSLVGMQAFAANDWSLPCTQGQCSYDLPSNSNTSATVQVWGASTAISDITEAAGWKILDCDPNGMNQTIRMVCMNADSQNAGCDHVMKNGAENKLVRMPESCGKMPFARVANMWVPADQSMPAATRRSLLRRDGTAPTVHAMTLDTNFGAANGTQHGTVSFAVQGLNAPGQNGQFPSAIPSTQGRRYVSRPVMDMKHRRGLFSSIGDTLQGKFNETKKSDPTPVDVSVDKKIVNLDVNCPRINGNVQVDLNAKAHADVTVGAIAAGTVIPPKLDDFGLLIGLDGNIDGTMNLQATAQGAFDSGAITVFTLGIPGLDIPGIFTLGPTFNVNGEVTGTVDLQLDMTVGLAYTFSNAQLEFPPGKASSSGNFGPSDNNFALSASPELAGSASLTAHLIPTLTVGIDVLSGLASANVFVNLDASATLALNGSASGTASVASGGAKSGSGTAQGCVDVSTGLNAHAGADASLFSFFDKTTQVTLFNKNFDLFQKCFTPKASASSSSSAKASSTKAASSKTSAASKSASTSAPEKAASTSAAEKSTAKTTAKGGDNSAQKATSAVSASSTIAKPSASASTDEPNTTAPAMMKTTRAMPMERAMERAMMEKRAGISCTSSSPVLSLVTQLIKAAAQKPKA